MKVVIFCGGQGLRMREASDLVPKPMVPIGNRPVLWHVMKYYAHFGFTDFVLCLGYKAEAIKQFFLTYNEAMANDFVLSNGGADVHLLKTDIQNWNITFVDTGLRAPIGERLRAVRHLLADDELFLANYGDTLTDADLPAMIARAKEANAMASFLAVRPNYSFHVVSMEEDGRVRAMRDVMGSDIWINGGYFVLRREFLDQLRPGEDLVEEPLQRLLPAGKVLAQRHEGFWGPMDTLKDKQWLENLHEEGMAPWQVWDPDRATRRRGRVRRGGMMLPLELSRPGASPARVLALGAHPDDIEIGCGGTILKLIEQGAVAEVHWVVLSGEDERAEEARASAAAMLGDLGRIEIDVCDFSDGFFPYEGKRIKDYFEGLKRELAPDLVFTHQRADLHQDHRTTCELTWNTFRDHLILEYEVPKYDGDMSAPNAFVPISENLGRRKIDHLMEYFGSQRSKRWFEEDLFSGLLRLRGMECNSPSSLAEAFFCRKAVLA